MSDQKTPTPSCQKLGCQAYALVPELEAAQAREEELRAEVERLVEKGKANSRLIRTAVASGRGVVVTWGMDDFLKELESLIAPSLAEPETP